MGLKKVLFVNYSYSLGSTGRLVEELGRYLEDQGIKTFYVCKKAPSDTRNNVLIVGEKFKNLVAGLYSRVSGLQGYGCYFQTRKVIDYIDDVKPDIVHLHNLHGNFLNFKLLFDYLKRNNIKTVWTFHDCWPFTGNCANYTEEKCIKWKDGQKCKKCPNIRKYPPSWFFDRGRKMIRDKEKVYGSYNFDIVTVSEWLREEAKQSFLKGKNIRCIYNWVDLDEFKELPKDIVSVAREKYNFDCLVLCVASDWSIEKGILKILDIAKNTSKSIGFIIVGNCRKRYKKSLKNVFFVGTVKSKQELSLYYNLCDCTLSLSQAETFGLTVAEALACNKPSIVMNGSAASEVLGECGIVVDDSSIGEIDKLIVKLKSENLNCRKRAEELFAFNNNVDEYLKLYKTLSKD